MKNRDYNVFLKFIDTFTPFGFKDIDICHPLVIDLEKELDGNKQFFLLGDIIQMKILYTSTGSKQILGINSQVLTPYHIFEATRPDEMQRHSLARAKLFRIGQELFIEGDGYVIASTNFHLRNPVGVYSNTLIQCYLVHKSNPYKTVYLLQIFTDISWWGKNIYGYHFYIGEDMAFFRPPDTNLLKIGLNLSEREVQIVRLIELGLNSEQIGDKLYISKNTVDTHRQNILKKTGKKYISDLIYSLKESGML